MLEKLEADRESRESECLNFFFKESAVRQKVRQEALGVVCLPAACCFLKLKFYLFCAMRRDFLTPARHMLAHRRFTRQVLYTHTFCPSVFHIILYYHLGWYFTTRHTRDIIKLY